MTITDIIRRGRSVLSPSESWSPMTNLQRDINRLFEDVWSGAPGTLLGRDDMSRFSPAVEISETAKHVEVSAELPGMTADDVEVALSRDNDVLWIKGEKRSQSETKGGDFYRCERHYGAFRRGVSLPCPVEPEGVEAMFRDGVLEIKLPKASGTEAGIKEIPIKAKQKK